MGKLPDISPTLTGFLRESQRKALRQVSTSPFAGSGITTLGDGTSVIVGPLWTAALLLNSWVEYGLGYRGAGFCQTVDGSVKLRGFVASGATGVPIFILEDGYRPTATEVFVAQAGGGGTARVEILATGDVVVASYNGTGSNAFLSLSGIRFSLSG